MKLLAKHLASYLPYALKCQVTDLQKIKIAELHAVYMDGSCTFCDTVESIAGFSSIKPILIPLNKLSSFAKGIKQLGYRSDENNFLNLISLINDCRCNYDLMQLCFEEHIDVFGLIEAGLAIDKNTITD